MKIIEPIKDHFENSRAKREGDILGFYADRFFTDYDAITLVREAIDERARGVSWRGWSLRGCHRSKNYFYFFSVRH